METADLLQIKIEKAKRELPLDAVNAIDSVNWRAVILAMRETKGYTFEQLGDLELETELLLSGLLNPKDYPIELEKRMGVNKSQANEIVNEMNEKVFAKIKEELIKSTERKQTFVKNEKSDTDILSSAGIEIIPANSAPKPYVDQKANLTIPELPAGENIPPRPVIIQKEEIKPESHPILTQKFSMPVQTPIVRTEHTLDNITKTNTVSEKISRPAVDPYREIPE